MLPLQRTVDKQPELDLPGDPALRGEPLQLTHVVGKQPGVDFNELEGPHGTV